MNLTELTKNGAASRAPSDHPALLRLEHVRKNYVSDGQVVHAVDDVSLSLNPADFLALTGRSGCGKSSLLNLAGAMDFPTSGTVWLDGESTSQLNDAELTRVRRQKVGFIFQSFQLLNTLSVIENVELPLLLAGIRETRTRAQQQLDLVDIGELASRMPHQLSGGQMQRVAIARALVHRPLLLLADEPTGNLDTATGNLILGLLRRIADERQVAIIMATHSGESTRYCDAVIKMRDGRIEESRHS
jgi:ABC-type lipoprotein export system ATPase subunit